MSNLPPYGCTWWGAPGNSVRVGGEEVHESRKCVERGCMKILAGTGPGTMRVLRGVKEDLWARLMRAKVQSLFAAARKD